MSDESVPAASASGGSEPTVLYERDGLVGIVTLNRPQKLNALTMDMRLAVQDRLAEADADAGTSVIILRAAGRSFCVGFDVGGGGSHPTPWRHDALKYHDRLTTSTNALMSPWNVSKPVIASVQGHALGGGCQLAMFCDITLAADDAQFGEPEILFSQVGPAVVMPWLIGHKRARELIYFGDKIDAETALELRMINRIYPRDALAEATMRYARRMSKIAPEALKAAKRAVNRGIEAQGFRDAIRSGIDVLSPLYAATTDASREFDEIRKREGLKAALKWRLGQLAEE
ncbi:MAG: enoyl-CoA hydratase [Pseudomonadota bacterium]|jgi:enoyl-CoA hydratase/carnithine racemase